jgi:hypothetical protein
MSAAKLSEPLVIEQGATFIWPFLWQAGPTMKTLEPVDLTGCTARMQVRAEIDSVDVLLDLTTENSGIVLGGATGMVTVEVSATATSAIDWTSGVFDLEVSSPRAPWSAWCKGACAFLRM